MNVDFYLSAGRTKGEIGPKTRGTARENGLRFKGRPNYRKRKAKIKARSWFFFPPGGRASKMLLPGHPYRQRCPGKI